MQGGINWNRNAKLSWQSVFFAEKKKAGRRIGIQMKPALHQSCQTRYLFQEIGCPDGKIDMFHTIGYLSQHDFLSASSTSVSWKQVAAFPTPAGSAWLSVPGSHISPLPT